jgi:hypothetical protein
MTFQPHKYLLRATLALSAAFLLATAPVRAEDKGDFKPFYGETKNEKFLEWKEYLQEADYLEDMSKWLSDNIELPHDIGFTTGECGTVNAFYDPNTKQITLCYEFMTYLEDLFREDYPKQEELDETATNALTFIAYHEVGHALVDVLDLPITGKEEDAVDQLSAYLLCDETEADEKMQALDGALAFLNMALKEEDEMEKLAMWQAHSLSQQRFYNILTLIYGSDPNTFEAIKKDGLLPEGRADGAIEEWNRARKAWNAILAPHWKE